MRNDFFTRLGATGIMILVVNFSNGEAIAQGKTNRELLFELCGEATSAVIDSSKTPSDTAVCMIAEPDTLTQIFFQTLVESFHRHFRSVVLKECDSLESLTVSVVRANVWYGDSFTLGMFGARRCRRTVEVGVQGTAVDPLTRKVRWAGTVSRSVQDTILVDDISSVEPSAGLIGKGSPPGRSFLDALVEPFVIIAATGVAVYLFFTIRS
jgi:hypothetical protein